MKKKIGGDYSAYAEMFKSIGAKPLSYSQWLRATR